MTYQVDIDHKKRRVTVVVVGEGRLLEGLATLGRIYAAGGIPYAKLVDFTFAKPEEGTRVRQITDFVARFTRNRKPGPLAIVATSEWLREMVEIFRQQIGDNRRIEVFGERAAAEAWLESLNVSEPAS